jgi:acetyl-CoA carboxylase carboxyltransferase component
MECSLSVELGTLARAPAAHNPGDIMLCMSWKREVDEIQRRRELAAELGGADAVAAQHAKGRLTVRERIAALVDDGSFREHGAIAGQSETDAEGRLKSFQPANVVTGIARIDGRPVVIGGDDFTIRGAAYSAAGLRKGQYADELAIRRRVPLIRLLEGGGASVAGTTGVRGRSGYDMVSPPPLNLLCVEALASVPTVCAALGPVAGFPAARLVASHFSIMTRDTAQVLVGGPALVERALGETATKEELGGWQVHLRSGVVDNVADDEADVWRQMRVFLSYLPANVWETPPVLDSDDPPSRAEEELLSIVPRNRRRAYDMRRLIGLVVDRGSLFEKTPLYGRSQITGLARVRGQPVGVLANDPHHLGGSMSADGAQKVRRFVELCDAFSLPIVSFVDEPGFMIGTEAERAGTIRHGMSAMFAVLQTEVPWLAVVVRRAFGVALGIHLGRGCAVLAWPSAESGALPVEGGVALAFGREIAEAPDPDARRRELEDELAAAQSVFPRAEDFGVHHLIDPRETRAHLCSWIDEIQGQLRLRRAPRTYTMRP